MASQLRPCNTRYLQLSQVHVDLEQFAIPFNSNLTNMYVFYLVMCHIRMQYFQYYTIVILPSYINCKGLTMLQISPSHVVPVGNLCMCLVYVQLETN